MDCPQCGTALTTLSLQGHEALVCERCGYVGIDADHHGNRHPRESWHDALRRFYDESGVDSDPHVPVRPDRSGASGDDAGDERRSARESTRPTDRPAPRPTPDGTPAVRPAADGADARSAEREGGAEREGETDTDGAAVDDGVRPSAGGS